MAFTTEEKAADQSAPSEKCFAITPSDGADLAVITNGIAFKTVGALHILDADGNDVTIPSGVLAVGIIHKIRVRKVFSTGTGAGMDLWGFA